MQNAFQTEYTSAESIFVTAATAAGAVIERTSHPLRGPRGERLGTLCAWIGPRDAARVFVTISGAHGAEGFAGSGMQVSWLRRMREPGLPQDSAVLFIHGINPFGFAWLRRTTEEGVDLNRNFVDFSQSLPDNPGYRELADAFVTHSIDEASLIAAEARFADYRARHGEAAYLAARGAGQYSNPEGLFYGGGAPTWARRTSEAIIDAYTLTGRKVAVVDLHTGLGPYGYGELIAGADPMTEQAQRLVDWYGPTLTQPALGGSVIVPQLGMAHLGWRARIGDGLTFAYLEFGTRVPFFMQRALCRDHWLHAQGTPDWDDPLTRGIKADMLHAYMPARPDWHEMVAFRASQVFDQALAGLAAQ